MRNGTLTFAGSSAWVMVCAAFAAHCGSSSGGGGGSPDGATTDATTDSGEGPDVAEETQGASDGSDASPPIDASDGGAGMDGSPGMDGTMPSGDAAAPQRGCPADAGTNDCFTVYASTGTDLYYLDLTSASLVHVGTFDALEPDGGSDVITDLAVTPDDTIWLVSATALYRADGVTGRATFVGTIASCGTGNVALTADGTGSLFLGDPHGALCSLDPSATPPTVTSLGSLSGGFALAGDLVTAGSTTYGTVYSIATPTTLQDNWLATIVPASGATTALPSATGFPKLYGLAYGGHHPLGFTADGSGRVVSIDPNTGVGAIYGTFSGDGGTGLAFAGAGVNPNVSP